MKKLYLYITRLSYVNNIGYTDKEGILCIDITTLRSLVNKLGGGGSAFNYIREHYKGDTIIVYECNRVTYKIQWNDGYNRYFVTE